MLSQVSVNNQSKKLVSDNDIEICQFIRFLKHIHLKEHLSKVSDPRDPSKIKYSNYSFLLYAFSVFAFRQGSKNAIQTTLETLSIYQRSSFLKFLELEHNTFPHRTVVDDYLNSVEPEEINHLLIELFRWCQRSKLFYNHVDKLLPNNSYHLGVDGFWIHQYNSPHAVDKLGNNCCPYCLPKSQEKGGSREVVWTHILVTFVLVFPTGLQLPIFVYPVKASQAETFENDQNLKQECELTAFYKALPEIRKKLGRIPITLLLDALYASEPVVELAESLGMNYLIVQQEGRLKNLRNKCNELDSSQEYQQLFRLEERKMEDNNEVERRARWYNQVALGKRSFTNVLRFEEVIKNQRGEIIDTYKNEWLSRERIHKGNCLEIVKRGRLRFSCHEDLHNTLKNRGYEAKHDYARANPNGMIVWKLLMFVAFFVCEIFSITKLGVVAKGSRSWLKFYRDLLQQLVNIPYEIYQMSRCYMKAKVQFRFTFGVPSG